MKKRMIGLLLCLALLIGVLPAGLFTLPAAAYSEEESYAYWSGENNGEKHKGKPASGGYAYYDRETNTLEIKDFTYYYDYPENKRYKMFDITCDGLTVNLIGSSTVNLTSKRTVDFVVYVGACEITAAKEASLSVTVTGDTSEFSECFNSKKKDSSGKSFDSELIIGGKASVSLFAINNNNEKDFIHAVAVCTDQVTVKDSAKVFLYGSHMAAMMSGGMCTDVFVGEGYDPLVKVGSGVDDSTERTFYDNKIWTWTPYLSVTPAPPKPPEPIPITSVTVRLFESPVGGAAAGSKSNLYIPAGEPYSFNPSQRNGGYSFWCNSNSVALRDSATFSGRSSYTEFALLVADEGYYFAADCKFYAYDNQGNAVPLNKTKTGVSESDNTQAYIYAAAMEASPAAYGVLVNGKQVTPSNQDNVLGNSGTPAVTFSPRSNTLTLNGYDGGYIRASIPLNIVLADGSQNRITVPAATEECGIYCEGDLSISGGGSLTVVTKPQYCEAICNLDGDLTVDMSGDLTVDSAMKGIMSGDGYVRLSGTGKVKVTAGTDGISSHSHTILENEASVTVAAGKYAVWMFDGTLLLDGTGTPITLTSGDGNPAVYQDNGNEYLVASTTPHMRYVVAEGAPEKSHVVYRYAEEEEEIRSATIRGLSSPAAGGTPRTQPALFAAAGEHFTVVSSDGMSSEWVDRDTMVLSPDDVFVLNKEYAQVFYLIADAGYRFASDCTFTLIGTDGQNKSALVASTLPDEPYYAMIAASFVKAVPAASVLLGDIDNDGDADANDLTLLARAVAKIDVLSAEQQKAADVNRDGFVDANDLTRLARHVAKIELL